MQGGSANRPHVTFEAPTESTIDLPILVHDVLDHIDHGRFACFPYTSPTGASSIPFDFLSIAQSPHPIAAMPDLEVQVSPETRTALKTDLTLRYVIRAKYRHEKSRRSAVVIPWAQSLAERLSSAMVQEVGQQTTGFSIQLNMIQMLGLRNIVYICYDLFLDECDQDFRAEISENIHLKRPIHVIHRKNKVFIIQRDPRADAEVLQQYLDMRKADKGRRPLFSDLKHPPVFDENGHRVIECEELTDSQSSWIKQENSPEKMGEGEKQEQPTEGQERQEGKEDSQSN